jgi:hypothetical protein
MKKLRFQSVKIAVEEVENVGVVSLVQLNGGYISSIEQSRTAERFKEDFPSECDSKPDYYLDYHSADL